MDNDVVYARALVQQGTNNSEPNLQSPHKYCKIETKECIDQWKVPMNGRQQKKNDAGPPSS